MFNMDNPMFNMMKNYMNPEMFMQYAKNMPAMNFSEYANMMKKNAEILSKTNQMAAESAQSMMKKSAEVFQNNANNMLNALKEASSARDMEQARACHQKYMKDSFENTMNSTREIMEMGARSSMEIFQTLGKNMSENMTKSFNQNMTKGPIPA